MSINRGIILLRALVTIGTMAPRSVKARDIADRIQVSTSYLEQILSKAKSGGVVRSIRGPGGGYIAADRTVTVGEVIAMFKEPEEFSGDVVGALMSAVSRQVDEAMSRVTVDDLVKAAGPDPSAALPSIAMAFEPLVPKLMPNPGVPNSVFALGGLAAAATQPTS